MQISDGACPITLPCIQTFLRLERESFTHELFHLDNAFDWDEFRRSAAESGPTPESCLLRAFYAFELIYHRILPRMFFTANDPQMQSAFLALRSPRSIEGLKEVLELSERYKRRVAAKRVSTAIKDNRSDNSAQVQDVLQKQEQIVDALVGSAQTLKTCMRHKATTGLTLVGNSLGESFHLSGESDHTVQAHLTVLLKINPQNAVTPWKQQISEPTNYPV